MTWNQILNFVCDNRELIVPLLGLAFGASILSGWSDKMPPAVTQIVHFIAGNWGDIARAIISRNPPPSSTGQK